MNMLKRISVAVVFIPLIFIVIYVLPDVWLPITVSVLSVVAVHEAMWSTGFVKHIRISGYSLTLAGLIPFWAYYDGRMKFLLLAMFIYVLLLFVEAMLSHFTVTMEKMGGAFFLSIVIPMFLSSLLEIRQMELGEYYILLPFVAAFTSDAFALFAGMLFGKHKLAPELSPKKTVEGAVGGAVGAVVCCMIFGLVVQYGFGIQARLGVLALYGLLGSVVSSLGDLSFSYIKRQYNIKDFGNIFPGHGGVLDRFDSMVFCAPLFQLLLCFLPALVR